MRAELLSGSAAALASVTDGVTCHERETAATRALAERTVSTLARLQSREAERRCINRPTPRAWRTC